MFGDVDKKACGNAKYANQRALRGVEGFWGYSGHG